MACEGLTEHAAAPLPPPERTHGPRNCNTVASTATGSEMSCSYRTVRKLVPELRSAAEACSCNALCAVGRIATGGYAARPQASQGPQATEPRRGLGQPPRKQAAFVRAQARGHSRKQMRRCGGLLRVYGGSPVPRAPVHPVGPRLPALQLVRVAGAHGRPVQKLAVVWRRELRGGGWHPQRHRGGEEMAEGRMGHGRGAKTDPPAAVHPALPHPTPPSTPLTCPPPVMRLRSATNASNGLRTRWINRSYRLCTCGRSGQKSRWHCVDGGGWPRGRDA
jgi:hypothetical protein